MRFAPSLLAVLVLPALVLAPGCKSRQEEAPPPPPPAAPVSIWSEADSQAVAQQLVDGASAHSWTSQFRDRNGRAARLAVGSIEDRSGKNVSMDGFSAAITKAIGSAGGDKLTTGEPIDFYITGAITASSGSGADGAPATWFAIDLTVKDNASGDTVWPFAVERPIATP